MAGYNYERTAALTDNQSRGRITHALQEAYKSGGFEGLMLQAYNIEAGKHPFEHIENRPKWLEGILNQLSRSLSLTEKELFRLHNYRDQLRRG